MRVMITGVTGQLGYDIYNELIKRGVKKEDIYAPTHRELDLTQALDVLENVINFYPDVIFHCAAYTAVDKAETEKKECEAVNVIGTQNIANVANLTKSKLVYISTDYVFDGTKDAPYDVNDKPNPINYYGLTKLKGEEIVRDVDKSFIFRISWVFGVNGRNFIKTMLKLSETKDEVKVVADQLGSPTYTEDLAKLLVDASMTDKYGVYHATNEGFTTWADIAANTFKFANRDTKVIPIPTSEYPTTAARPLNSRLSKKSLDDAGFERLPQGTDAIERYVKKLVR